MHPNTTWPNKQEIAHLTAELLAHRASAPVEIAAAFLEPLAAYLCREFPKTDPDLCYEAAGQAILDTGSGKNHYDPTRSDLDAFLRMAAMGDLRNLRAREYRRTRRLVPLAFVEEPAERGNTSAQDADGPNLDRRLVAEIASFTPIEQTTFELLLTRERSTEECARVLELQGTPAELERAVKRFKDRVKARLRRAVGGKR